MFKDAESAPTDGGRTDPPWQSLQLSVRSQGMALTKGNDLVNDDGANEGGFRHTRHSRVMANAGA
jgi:hypothetical protein